MFVLIESRTTLKIGHVRLKTRSLGQILWKLCVCFRGHIFSPIIMKLGQNACLEVILDEVENGSCQVKNYVTRSNLRKTLLINAIQNSLESSGEWLAPPGWLSVEPVWLMTWCLWVQSQVEATFLSGVFSPLTSAEACEKSSRWLLKEKLC